MPQGEKEHKNFEIPGYTLTQIASSSGQDKMSNFIFHYGKYSSDRDKYLDCKGSGNSSPVCHRGIST